MGRYVLRFVLARTKSMYMKDTTKIDRIGNLFGFTGGSFAGMVYGIDGLCPTINCMGGGNREPLILEEEEK